MRKKASATLDANVREYRGYTFVGIRRKKTWDVTILDSQTAQTFPNGVERAITADDKDEAFSEARSFIDRVLGAADAGKAAALGLRTLAVPTQVAAPKVAWIRPRAARKDSAPYREAKSTGRGSTLIALSEQDERALRSYQDAQERRTGKRPGSNEVVSLAFRKLMEHAG